MRADITADAKGMNEVVHYSGGDTKSYPLAWHQIVSLSATKVSRGDIPSGYRVRIQYLDPASADPHYKYGKTLDCETGDDGLRLAKLIREKVPGVEFYLNGLRQK